MISVHGGDVLGVAEHFKGGREAVDPRVRGRAAHARQLGGDRGAQPRAGRQRRPRRAPRHRRPDRRTTRGTHLVTVGNLIARKRHADVLHALALLPGTRYVIVGDGPERPALERLAARLGVDVEFRGALPPRAGARTKPAAPAPSSSPAPRRPSASPTSRRWPAACRRSARAASPARRRSRPAAAACASSRRTTRPRWRRRSARRSPDDGDDRPRERRAPTSPGSSAARPRSPPTRTRCDEAGPVRHQPRARVPRRRVQGAARPRARRLRADRRERPPRRRGHGRRADDAVPRRTPVAAGRRAARRQRPLPRRDRRHVGQGRAPRRLRRRPRGTDPVRAVGDDLGPPAHARADRRLSPAAPHLPPRGRDRHLRPARVAPTSAPSTRRARSSRRRRRSTRAFWEADATPERHGDFQILFAGRPAPEKGFDVLAARGRRRARW